MELDYISLIVQSNFYGFEINICWDCENYCGKCPWTGLDPETGRVKFDPVPGWKTKKKSRKQGRSWEVVEQIVECPLFVQTPEKEK